MFGPVHKNNVGAIKKLVHTVLPVSYSDHFYETLMATPEAFTHACAFLLLSPSPPPRDAVSLAGYFNNLLVGVIGCRPEKREDGKERLYVAVLAVLAAYRGLGLGSRLVNSVIESLESHPDVAELYLHVHVTNAGAIRFYERLGFENVGVIKDYYASAELSPPDCVLLRRVVGEGVAPSVDLAHGGLGAPVIPS
jgi:N-alpha-acetyltransferase 50